MRHFVIPAVFVTAIISMTSSFALNEGIVSAVVTEGPSAVLATAQISCQVDITLVNQLHPTYSHVLVVGLRDAKGAFVTGTTPVVVLDTVPPSPGNQLYSSVDVGLPTISVATPQTYTMSLFDAVMAVPNETAAIGVFETSVVTQDSSYNINMGSVTVNPSFTLTTMVASGQGTLDPPTGPQQPGNPVTLTASPDALDGYYVLQWSGTDNDASTEMMNVVTMTAPKTVTVSFSNTYTLTATAVGDHGTVAPGAGNYTYGTVVTLTASPDECYRVKQWTGTNNDALKTNTNTVTVTQDTTVTVEYEVIPYTLTVTPPATGTLAVAEAGPYTCGQTVHLTATPISCYQVASWTGVDSSSGNTATVLMTSDKAVSVVFEPIPIGTYVLTVTPPANGALVATESAPYNCGQTVGLTAAPAPCYRVASWAGVDSSNGTTATVLMNGNRTVSVTFELIPYTLTLTPPANGTLVATESAPYTCGEMVHLTAAPAPCYRVASWTGVDSPNGNTATVTVNGDTTVAVTFQLIPYTLTLMPSAGGTLAATELAPYTCGETLHLIATADIGYRVNAWTGDASPTGNNSATVLMTGDKTAGVSFIAANATLTTEVLGGHGTLTPATGSQPLNAVVLLTTTADNNYRVKAWTGTDNDALLTPSNSVTMTEDKTVTAAFTYMEGILGVANVSPDFPDFVGTGHPIVGQFDVTLLNDLNPNATHTLVIGYRDPATGLFVNVPGEPQVVLSAAIPAAKAATLGTLYPGLAIGLQTPSVSSPTTYDLWLYDVVNAASDEAAIDAFEQVQTPTVESSAYMLDSYNYMLGQVVIEPSYILTTKVASGDGTLTPATGPQQAQSTVTLIATAGQGYYVKQWSGTDDDTSTSATNVVYMSGPKTVTVGFSNMYTVTGTVVGGGGTVTPASQAVEYNGTATLTAVADSCYRVKQWSSDTGAITPSPDLTTASLTVTANTNVTVEFEPISYNLTVLPPANGTLAAVEQPPYLCGETVHLLATTVACYQAVSWTGVDNFSGNMAALVLTGDTTVSVAFGPLASSLVLVAPANGQLTADEAGPYTCGQSVNLTATPATCYRVASWTGVAASNGNAATVVVSGVTTVSVAFELIPYALTLTPPVHGTLAAVQPPPYTCGQTVQLLASADIGYRVDAWTSVLSSNGTTATVVMTGDKSVGVSFVAAYAALTTEVVGGHGAISPATGPQPLNAIVALQAAADATYRVKAWTGTNDDTLTTPGNAVTMTIDKLVTVSFAYQEGILDVANVNGLATPMPAGASVLGSCDVTLLNELNPETTHTLVLGLRDPATGAFVAGTTPKVALSVTPPSPGGQLYPDMAINLPTIPVGSPQSYDVWIYDAVNAADAVYAIARFEEEVTPAVQPGLFDPYNYLLKTIEVEPSYMLTTEVVNGVGGMIAPPTGPQISGAPVGLTATPDAVHGYYVEQWAGTDNDTLTTNTNTVTMNAPKTVAVTFSNMYTLTASVVGGLGTVTPASAQYAFGQMASLTAAAEACYRVATVTPSSATVTLTPTGATITVAITGATAVTVAFEPIPYTLALGPSLTADPPGPYVCGEVVNLTATVPGCMQVAHWTGTDNNASTLATNTVTLGANTVATVAFTPIIYSLALSSSGNGTVVAVQAAPYTCGEMVSLAASPASGYLTVWPSGVTVNPVDPNHATVSMNSDKVVTVAFVPAVPVLTLTPAVNGALAAVEQPPYTLGEVVHLTATPASCYQVSSWTGTDNDASTSVTNTVTMSDNKTVSVQFTPITTNYVLTLSMVGDHGTVAATETAPYTCGETVNLVATAAAGFRVKAWTGADVEPSTAANNTVTMTADKTVTVELEQAEGIANEETITGASSVLAGQPVAGEINVSLLNELNPSATQTLLIGLRDATTGAWVQGIAPQVLLSAIVPPSPGAQPYPGLLVSLMTLPVSDDQTYAVSLFDAVDAPDVATAVAAFETATPTVDDAYNMNLGSVTVHPSYLLTTEVVNGVGGTLEPATGPQARGNTVTLTATPSACYQVLAWSGTSNDALTTTANTVAMTSDKLVTVEFGLIPYTLAYAAGPNGTVDGLPSETQTVNCGNTGTLVTAIPDTGYHFVQWSDASTQNPRTDANVTADLSVTAVFAIDTFTLTYTATAGGAIVGTTPQTVNYGAGGTAVAAVASAHYHFVQWSDGLLTVVRTDANVTADLAVTATFAIDTVTLTYLAGSNGSITGTTPQTVSYGTSGAAVTAVANTGYHFVQWSDGLLTAARTDATVTADITVTATFAIDTFTLTYTAGSNGSIIGASPQTVLYGADGATVTAVPNAHYHFVNWSDASTQNPRRDLAVAATVNVTATFAIDTFTLTYTAGANGSISGASPQIVNYGASGAAVTAVANAGHLFTQWSDASTQNPRMDVNVTANVTVAAAFTPSVPVLTLTPGANGTLAAVEQPPYTLGELVHLTATPDSCYQVSSWTGTDNDASTSTTNTVTMNGDKTVTVAFVPITANYTLALSAPADHGTLVAASPAPYTCGQVVNLVATAQAGYRVKAWTGADVVPSTAANNTVTMTADKAVTVEFEQAEGIASEETVTATASVLAGQAVTADINVSLLNELNPAATQTLLIGLRDVTTGAWVQGIEPQVLLEPTVPASPGAQPYLGLLVSLMTLPVAAEQTYAISLFDDVNAPDVAAAVAAFEAATPLADDVYNVNLGSVTVAPSYVLTTEVVNGVGGTIEPATGPQARGNTVTLTATPSACYQVVAWTGTANDTLTTAVNSVTMTSDKLVTVEFGLIPYTLTYTAGAGGAVDGLPSETQVVNCGNTGTLVTAVADTGYHFVQWSDGVQTSARTDGPVTADLSVTAVFAIDTFTLTYTATAGGTIVGTTPQTVEYNGSGTAVTAVANAHYHFVRWSDNLLLPAGPRIDTNVIKNINAEAIFAIDMFTLTYTAGSNGSIVGTSAQTVVYGADGAAVTAVPNAHYHFVNWSDASTQNPRTDTNVTANVTVTAAFAIDTFTLTYLAGPNGSIVGTDSQTVSYGASGAAVTAVSSTGYHFVAWSDSSTQNPRTDLAVTADISVTASFVQQFTLTYMAGANGTISGTSPQTVNFGSPGTAVTAVANAGYSFVKWSDASTQNPRTDLAVTANASVAAAFAANATVTLTLTATTNGTVTADSANGQYLTGQTATLTAVPATGYRTQWPSNVTVNPTNANEATIVMNADATVTVTFALITYELTITVGDHGTLDAATGPQPAGSTVTLTAAPDTGYQTVWPSNVTVDASDPNKASIVMAADESVTVSFELLPQFNLETSVTGGHGTLTPPTGAQTAYTPVTLVATPDAGYRVQLWLGTDNDATTATSNIVTMTADKAVSVSFELIPAPRQFALTTLVLGGHGQITPPTPASATGGVAYYDPLTVATLTAIPDPGYEVQQWTGTSNDLYSGNNNAVVMTGNKTVSVAFQPVTTQGISGLGGTQWEQWTLLGLGAGKASGEVTVDLASTDNPTAIHTLVVGLRDADGNYITGSTPMVIWNAVPAAPMPPLTYTLAIPAVTQPTTFYVWLYDAQENGNTAAAVADFENAKATGADATNRLLGVINIAPDYWLTTAITDNIGGSITPAPPGIQGTQNEVITLTAAPDPQYHLTAWQGTDNDALTTLSNTVTMTKAKQVSVQYRLNVDAVVSLNLTVVSDHGTVAAVEQTPYQANQVVDLVATPEPGYVVARWTGTDNDLALTTTNKVTLTSLDNEVSVTFEPTSVTVMLTTSVVGGHGDLTPRTGPQPKGSIVQLTAIPDAGYKVQTWTGTDNDVLTTNTNTVTMTDAKSVTVQFTLTGCPTPAMPEGLAATRGTAPDKVTVSWTAVAGATGYNVFRAPFGNPMARTLLASVTATEYVDTTATAATEDTILGCIPDGTFRYHEYMYWVSATNACGESALTEPVIGYLGKPSSKDMVVEKALPGHAGTNSALYVRLMSEDDIDDASVWAAIQGAPVKAQWISLSTTDGWVAYLPTAPWKAGSIITMTAGALTKAGAAIGPVTCPFTVDGAGNVAGKAVVAQPSYNDIDTSGLDLTKESNDEAALSTFADKSLPVLPEGIGPVYQISPEAAYTVAQRVWLPVPANINPSGLGVYYYHAGDNAGWYPGENVDGWLVPDSYLAVTVKGTTYLGFLINHTGIVQLAPAVQEAAAAPASVVSTRGMSGDLLILAAVIATLIGASRKGYGRARKNN